VAYSLNSRRRWLLPDRLHQMFQEQLAQLQQEEYNLLVHTSPDPELYPENKADTLVTSTFYQTKADQPIFRGRVVIHQRMLR
jgi:hypothetical protein